MREIRSPVNSLREHCAEAEYLYERIIDGCLAGYIAARQRSVMFLKGNKLFEEYKDRLYEIFRNESGITIAQSAKDDAAGAVLKHLKELSSHVLKAMMVEIISKENPLVKFDFELSTAQQRGNAIAEVKRQLSCGERSFPPLLTEKLGLAVSFAERHLNEMYDRLNENREVISKELFGGGQIQSILRIEGYAGDLHNGGRCTLIIETDRGKLLYKPHDCRGDVFFREIVEKYMPDTAIIPKCAAFGDEYGFCEFITASPTNTRESAARYYERFGRLSALFHALGSCDFHLENIMAVGEYPAPIDLETILTPKFRNVYDKALFDEPPEDGGSFQSDFNESLYISGILPVFTDNRELSPLLSKEDKNKAMPVSADGEKLTADIYLSEYLRGFETGYRGIMTIRSELKEMLDNFTDIHIRRLMRNTNDYMKFLRRSSMPDKLASREAQDTITEILLKGAESTGIDNVAAMANVEAAALKRGDIPYFYVLGGGCDLMSDGKCAVPEYFEKSPVDYAKSRLDRMSEAELDFELDIIKHSFELRQEIVPERRPPKIEMENIDSADEIRSAADALNEARGIFRNLAENAVTAPCGERNWLDINDKGQLAVSEPRLMKGTFGIGVFMAAYYAVTDDDHEKEEALGLIRDIFKSSAYYADSLKKARKLSPKNVNIGLSGIGGVLTALALIYRYTKLDEFAGFADNIIKSLNKLKLDEITGSDMIGGPAGAIMPLCIFPEYSNNETAKKLIGIFADKLLELQTLEYEDLKLWDTLGKNRPISGAGHGMAGIGAALCKAGTLLDAPRYFKAAADAFDYEHHIYSEKLGTWPDLRELPADHAMHGYCSGAPGIGLMLLSVRDRKDKCCAEYECDLDRAINAVLSHPFLYRDHLCCGNSASVDFLTELYAVTEDERYKEAARGLLSKMVRRKNMTGGFSFMTPEYRPHITANLFYGLSGVGYEFLRFARPDVIRSIFG